MDKAYRYWKDVHEDFFKAEQSKIIDRGYTEDLMLVCERFKLIDVN